MFLIFIYCFLVLMVFCLIYIIFVMFFPYFFVCFVFKLLCAHLTLCAITLEVINHKNMVNFVIVFDVKIIYMMISSNHASFIVL